MKKILIENFLVLVISFLAIDVVISNTILDLKSKSCYVLYDFYFELKKNCKGKEKVKASLPTVNIYTDNNGLRIRKNHQRSNDDKVFVYGSSFIYGTGLEYEDSVVGILEKDLNNYEFYNFSVAYGSPTINLYNLKESIKKNVIPKKIIMVLSLSDVLSEISIWKENSQSDRPIFQIYEQSKIKEEFLSKNFKLSKSIVYSVRNSLRKVKLENKGENDNNVRTTIQAGFTYQPLEQMKDFYTKKNFNDGINKIETKIQNMIKIAEKQKTDFYLVIFPFADTLEYGQDMFNWEVFAKNLCKVETCNFVNSFNSFLDFKEKNKNWYEQLFFVGDEHFTKLGHIMLADKLKKEVFNN